jgi:hypothetical protein
VCGPLLVAVVMLSETARSTEMAMVKARLRVTGLLGLEASLEMERRAQLRLEIQSRQRLSVVDG